MRKFVVNVNGVDYSVTVNEEEQTKIEKPITVDRKPEVRLHATAVEFKAQPAPVVPAAPSVTAAVPAVAIDGHSVNAPMPGKIVKVLVEAGQVVTAGEVVVVLEAMKMQNEIKAPINGTVSAVSVTAGQTVRPGESMVVIGN